MKTIKLQIPGMTHETGRMIVISALRRLGIYQVKTTSGEAEITYFEPVKKAGIIRAIEEEGFIVVNY